MATDEALLLIELALEELAPQLLTAEEVGGGELEDVVETLLFEELTELALLEDWALTDVARVAAIARMDSR